MKRALAVLAKAPAPGRAKTRLAASIGEAHAATMARAFVMDAIERSWPADRRTLWTTGEDDAWRAASAMGWGVAPQRAVDLGTRQADAIAHGLAHADAVVVSGTDAPDLPDALVELAYATLADHDVVLTPAWDGGYVLLGTRCACRGWFDGVTWSTERVFEQVASRVMDAGLKLAVTPGWYDVDTVADLSRLAVHSRASHVMVEPAPAPRTRQALEQLLAAHDLTLD